MKSVTVASMLNLADPQERFATPVVATGKIRNGVLEGNLVVKVCGDPTIESQFLPETQGFADSIAAAVRRMDITKIRGNVLIDESDFPDATTPPGWMDEDIPWYYGARLQGANFRDNRFRLRYPSKKTEPFVPDLKFSVIKGKGSKIDRKEHRLHNAAFKKMQFLNSVLRSSSTAAVITKEAIAHRISCIT